MKGCKVTGDSRTRLLKKNIIASFFIKGWTGCVQLLLVPLTLTCLGDYKNGLWMTISSMLIWIDNMDIGLGNGLRNKLAEVMAENDTTKARQYVSTTFFLLCGIMAIVLLVSVGIFSFDLFNLYNVLNVDSSIVPDLIDVLIVSFVITCLTFVFKLVGNVYLSLQLPAVNNAIVGIGQTLTLLVVIVLSITGSNSLRAIAFAYTLSPLVVNVIAFFYTMRWRYPFLCPSIKCFSKKYIESLASLGLRFFCLQIAGIILFMSSNFVISHLFTPGAVTPYQIAYRLFSLLLIVFMLIATPYWSATTDAYKKNDMLWIASSRKKLCKLLLGLAVALLLLVLFSQWIYRIWIGDEVNIPRSLSILMAVYIFELIYSQAYSFFLNGMGKLNLQLLMTILAAVAFYPLSYFMGNAYGLNGICMCLILVNLPGTIVNVLQFNYVIKKKKNGE